jgi:hypothetical protein
MHCFDTAPFLFQKALSSIVFRPMLGIECSVVASFICNRIQCCAVVTAVVRSIFKVKTVLAIAPIRKYLLLIFFVGTAATVPLNSTLHCYRISACYNNFTAPNTFLIHLVY